jgi:hypothetical protein
MCQLQLVDHEQMVVGVCTGVLVDPTTVLTAKHCVAPEAALRVQFVSADGDRSTYREIVATKLHAELDLAVLAMHGAVPENIVPIELNLDADPPLNRGATVQIGGFGSVPFGPAQFAVTQIDRVDPSSFEVFAQGRAAACTGDSGGPALVRLADGRVGVAGILSSGSASCAERDRYVRVDAARDWLSEVLAPGRPGPLLVNCDRLGVEGRCFGDSLALWCDAGMPTAQSCSLADTCGFSEAVSGFRCVPAGSDPCGRVSQLGQCVGTQSHRCVNGRVQVMPCEVCGASCRISVRTGEAICNES